MPRKKDTPAILQIPSYWLKHSHSLAFLLHHHPTLHPGLVYKCMEMFGFCNDEKFFVVTLLKRKRNMWVFRSNQQRFCGDFFVVDMSSPDPELRTVYALDLKMHAPLKVGGGGAGIQFKNIPLALDELADAGVIAPTTLPIKVTGDGRAMLSFLGVDLV